MVDPKESLGNNVVSTGEDNPGTRTKGEVHPAVYVWISDFVKIKYSSYSITDLKRICVVRFIFVCCCAVEIYIYIYIQLRLFCFKESRISFHDVIHEFPFTCTESKYLCH